MDCRSPSLPILLGRRAPLCYGLRTVASIGWLHVRADDYRPFSAFVVLFIVLLTSGWTVAADQSAEEPPPAEAPSPVAGAAFRSMASDYADCLVERASLEARIEVLERDIATLQATSFTGSQPRGFDDLPEDLRTALNEFRRDNANDLQKMIAEFADQQGDQLDRYKSKLMDVRAVRSERQVDRERGWLDGIVGRDMRYWRIAWCSLFLGLAIVYWHSRRQQWRTRVHGAKIFRMRLLRIVLIVLIVVGLTVLVILLDQYVPNAAQSLQDEIGELNGDLAELEEKKDGLEEQYEEAVTLWRAGAEDLAAPLKTEADRWAETHEKLTSVTVVLSVQSTLAEAVAEELTALSAEGEHSPSKTRYTPAVAGITLGLGWLFSVVGLASRTARRKRRRADTCPLCLSVGELVEDTATTPGTTTAIPFLRCTNELDNAVSGPADCGFTFPAYYRTRPKLYFPTLGHIDSGKTFWLAMAYRELIIGNYDSQVQFRPIRCEQAKVFAKLVQEIIDTKIRPGATQTHSIPHPLVFNFRDNDFWGKTHTLVNIFDYSGEVTQGMNVDHPQRQRALTADGYFYFLDPTKTAEEQAKALVDFHEDVKLITDATGGKFQAPVALCVSKIDLLNKPLGSGTEVDDFYDELEGIDPSGEDKSLGAIKARSELIRDMKNAIWKKWNIETQIRELFGERFMYFPLTPVGLNEPGVEDLDQRQITPQFILQPLLWLLHMNGYSVLR